MQEHDRLQRDLMLANDEIKSLKDQLSERSNLASITQAENERLTVVIDRSESRTRMWMGHCIKLIAQLDSIKAVIGTAERVAREAAQSAAEIGMDEALTDEDKGALHRIANGTTPPENRLNG